MKNLLEVELQDKSSSQPVSHQVEFDSDICAVKINGGDGDICAVKIDGAKLNDIHDLAVTVEQNTKSIFSLTKRINLLAYVATALVMLVLAQSSVICGWLYVNAERIDNSLEQSRNGVELEK